MGEGRVAPWFKICNVNFPPNPLYSDAEDEIEDIQQEISILSQLDSAYITKYYGSYLKGK